MDTARWCLQAGHQGLSFVLGVGREGREGVLAQGLELGVNPLPAPKGTGMVPLFPGWLLTGTYSRALRGSLQETGMEQEERPKVIPDPCEGARS